MNVAWALFWGGSWWSTKPCFFPCKVAAAGDERYLVCAAVAAAVVSCANWFLLCVLQRVVGASNFPFKIPLKKVLQNLFFFALASRSGFGAAISDAVARSSIVFRNSVFADAL